VLVVVVAVVAAVIVRGRVNGNNQPQALPVQTGLPT
jgi:hypothetical protein